MLFSDILTMPHKATGKPRSGETETAQTMSEYLFASSRIVSHFRAQMAGKATDALSITALSWRQPTIKRIAALEILTERFDLFDSPRQAILWWDFAYSLLVECHHQDIRRAAHVLYLNADEALAEFRQQPRLA